jgi:hypothetical protein
MLPRDTPPPHLRVLQRLRGAGLDARARVLAQVEDFCSAIGAAGAAPSPDCLSGWLVAAFLATEKLLLLELFPRVGAVSHLTTTIRTLLNYYSNFE